MTFQIIVVDIDKHQDLLVYICKYLWNEWEPHYRSLHGFNTIQDLMNMYKKDRNMILHAAINSDGKFLGCFSLKKSNIESYNWMTDVYVCKEHRNNGIATAMVRYAMNKKHHLAIHTETHLIGFYKKLGFGNETFQTITGHDGKKFEYYKMTYIVNDELQFSIYILLSLGGIALVAMILILCWK